MPLALSRLGNYAKVFKYILLILFKKNTRTKILKTKYLLAAVFELLWYSESIKHGQHSGNLMPINLKET